MLSTIVMCLVPAPATVNRRAKRALEENFNTSSTLSPSRSVDSQLHNLSLNYALQQQLATPISEQPM